MNHLIEKIIPEITRIRQTIHSQPELKYEEKITAKLVIDTLQNFGFKDLQTEVGGTGVVALIDSGKPGKTVALRADMDALPIKEETNLAYQSQHHGKMHACGHDGHTATLLACAYALSQSKDQFRGKIKLLFQPAEEGGAGAAAMIKEGVLDNPKVDAIFGYHNWPGMPIGQMGTRHGCLLASTSEIKLTVHGKGGHAAFPHLTCDPIYVAANIIQSLQSIISRQVDPTDPVVISITQFNSGTTNNVIPNTAHLAGTLRTTSPATRDRVSKSLSRLVKEIAAGFDATAELELHHNYPATINSSAEVDLVMKTAAEFLGSQNAINLLVPTMGGEDFAFYLEKIPGCYFFVGNGENSPSLHNSKYNFQDEIIPIAANLLCQVALNYLK